MKSNINDEYHKMLNDLDEKISNSQDLEYAKNKMYELSMLFIDEMQAMSEKYEDKINALAQNQKELEDKIQKIQKVVNSIEKDIYDEDLDSSEVYEFEIVCPYCNHEFVTEVDELKTEVQCPECENMIELDWESSTEEGGCSGNCSHCHSCDDEYEGESEEDDDM